LPVFFAAAFLPAGLRLRPTRDARPWRGERPRTFFGSGAGPVPDFVPFVIEELSIADEGGEAAANVRELGIVRQIFDRLAGFEMETDLVLFVEDLPIRRNLIMCVRSFPHWRAARAARITSRSPLTDEEEERPLPVPKAEGAALDVPSSDEPG
jgi:hypothetical protein